MSRNAENETAESYSMVQECVNSFASKERPDGGRDIQIEVPERFADLWLVKLGELRATMDEIREYEPEGAKAER